MRARPDEETSAPASFLTKEGARARRAKLDDDGPRQPGQRDLSLYQTRPALVGCFATYHWPWTSTKSKFSRGPIAA